LPPPDSSPIVAPQIPAARERHEPPGALLDLVQVLSTASSAQLDAAEQLLDKLIEAQDALTPIAHPDSWPDGLSECMSSVVNQLPTAAQTRLRDGLTRARRAGIANLVLGALKTAVDQVIPQTAEQLLGSLARAAHRDLDAVQEAQEALRVMSPRGQDANERLQDNLFDCMKRMTADELRTLHRGLATINSSPEIGASVVFRAVRDHIDLVLGEARI
jgi:hypothetical protein